ncbi:signal peptidase I [Stieleria sp. TO1_6]|uniref:signal peptidase I n=1 Tax=Stieleria tagensis TaxID=2956795 RepID=UPI00209B117E|nr:signal peptidase I [Stieleria tagensis]MCO8120943.1 signal peptidase I [Stieleria tagensis]
MSQKSSKPTEQPKKSGAKKPASDANRPDNRTREQKFGDSIRTAAQRETVEAFVVAFVLALLFRAFVAEAFVIPTGSMAPTLMGAHKDLFCQQCDHRFQVGASIERRGPIQDDTVVGGVCPNCHYLNNLDLAGNSNDATFNGDRILVSKFAYTLSEPERWDVIVFKFPGNPKQNYIKRLVGLPNETLSIQYGDVYVTPDDGSADDTMLRKPADKMLAMRHPVYQTDQQSELLAKSGYPTRLQPWRENSSSPPTDSWQIERNSDGVVAKLDAKDSAAPNWLRYFHRWPDQTQWETAQAGGSLADIDPYSSRLVSDFYAYDCYVTVRSSEIYQSAPQNARMSRTAGFNPSYESGGPISQFDGNARFGQRGNADYGLHWVGDLMVESDLSVDSECKEVTLEIVEAGVQYQCQIDLASGAAQLSILDGDKTLAFDGDQTSVKATTSVRAGDSFSVRFSNFDDQLSLWINDSLVDFEGPTTFDSRKFRTPETNYPHYSGSGHPLDAAPIGIAVTGGAATINRVKLDRDKYYIATDDSSFGIFDYDMNELWAVSNRNVSFREIQSVMQQPELWAEFPIWQTRRKVSFQLDENQFFPMGDNSPESLDARCWAGTKRGARLPDRFHEEAYAFADASYVPRDLLVGKALLVFWPHPWNTPVPFTPNFDRFRLIR